VGRFEAADRGTLLLDEVSEMPLELQTRLLRVLQEREVTRVGGSNLIAVDARIISTTNRDLRQMVSDGTFREDLYYRINVFPIHVPALSDRRADLAALSAAILVRRCRRFGCPVVTLGDDALQVLSQWRWPGNVRELQNVLERALVLSQGSDIGAEHIVLDEAPSVPMPSGLTRQATPVGGASSLRDMEQDTILSTLSALDGNRTRTAQRLGISIRTLRNRLRDYRAEGVLIPPPSRGVSSHLLVRSAR
jgi:two-component system response regulator FlrC